MWRAFDQDRAIGRRGIEGKAILLDEEHADGARITLEGGPTAPYVIRCGAYGWLLHTRYFGSEDDARAAYHDMKIGLDQLLEKVESATDEEATSAVSAFVERFP